MKNWFLISTSLSAVCGVFLLLSDASGQSGTAATRTSRPPARIAFIDLNKIVEHYKKAADLQEAAKASVEASNAKILSLRGEHEELIKQLKEGTFEPDTEEFREAQSKVFQLESYAKTYRTATDNRIQVENLKGLHGVYLEIQDALKVFSDQNGFTNVFRVDTKARTLHEPKDLTRIMGQDVIYNSAADDITNAVIAYLNREYERTTGKTAAPAREKSTSPSPRPSQSSPSANRGTSPRK